jgi:hypothetical protein
MKNYDYDRTKTAAVSKVPVFSKFEVKVPAKKIESEVAKHYDVVPGSCKLGRGVEQKHNGAYVNFTCQSTEGKTLTGSVITFLENHGNAVRAVAFINVDG